MANPKQPIALIEFKGKKHLTKAEIDERRATELERKTDAILPPDFLGADQKKEFVRLAKELDDIGIMSNLDCNTLAMYVVGVDRFKLLNKKLNDPKIAEDIFEYEKVFNLWDKSVKQCQSLAKSLGLTIDSRCKLIVPKREESKPINKFTVIGNG